MVELELAAASWKNIAEQVSLDKHPSLWVSHWVHDEMVGSVHATLPTKEAEHVLVLGSPFATCHDITDTFVFVDRPNTIMASRLTFDTITHWDLPYLISDEFKITFGVATKRPHPNVLIRHAIDSLWDHRLTSKHQDFHIAYVYSLERGAQIESN